MSQSKRGAPEGYDKLVHDQAQYSSKSIEINGEKKWRGMKEKGQIAEITYTETNKRTTILFSKHSDPILRGQLITSCFLIF